MVDPVVLLTMRCSAEPFLINVFRQQAMLTVERVDIGFCLRCGPAFCYP